jgi:hypothetical protein
LNRKTDIRVTVASSLWGVIQVGLIAVILSRSGWSSDASDGDERVESCRPARDCAGDAPTATNREPEPVIGPSA